LQFESSCLNALAMVRNLMTSFYLRRDAYLSIRSGVFDAYSTTLSGSNPMILKLSMCRQSCFDGTFHLDVYIQYHRSAWSWSKSRARLGPTSERDEGHRSRCEMAGRSATRNTTSRGAEDFSTNILLQLSICLAGI